jgi:UDP-N-acetylglucosamine--N-acetylmuramyl-(pentapeptide) pyrophosphoryl-undecaprenol N-acetylglucosamine transferase
MFAGAGIPLEREILGRHGYRHMAVASGGMVGKSSLARVRGAVRALRGVLQSFRTLMKVRPKAVIGVGGYASGPMVMAAVALRIPTLIHEQNCQPGLTNRLLAPWVSRVAVSFEETRRHLGGRGELTGNPIRAIFREAGRRTQGGGFHVLIFGGSQGARAINDAVVAALPLLRRPGLRITHGTGAADWERVSSAYTALGLDATVLPYITSIREAYDGADLVIARAGASSVSEIAACGRASILVPLPTAAHDHQRRNARVLAEAGAAVLLEEKDLDGATLARAVLALRDDPGRLRAMERAAASLARPDAAARIAGMVEELFA